MLQQIFDAYKPNLWRVCCSKGPTTKKEPTAEEVAAAHAMEELREQQDYDRANQGTNKIFSTSKPKVRLWNQFSRQGVAFYTVSQRERVVTNRRGPSINDFERRHCAESWSEINLTGRNEVACYVYMNNSNGTEDFSYVRHDECKLWQRHEKIQNVLYELL